MDKLIRITRNITFDDLNTGRKSPIDVYEDFTNSCLFYPIEQLSNNKQNTFENGYAMLALELLFFEPHGKYLLGKTEKNSGKSFESGFEPFLLYLMNKNLIEKEILKKINVLKFYGIARCGIFHNLAIIPGMLLIDSIFMKKTKVFYDNPTNKGILVNPWNFLTAQKGYFNNYIKSLKEKNNSNIYKNFEITFKKLFKYKK